MLLIEHFFHIKILSKTTVKDYREFDNCECVEGAMYKNKPWFFSMERFPIEMTGAELG